MLGKPFSHFERILRAGWTLILALARFIAGLALTLTQNNPPPAHQKEPTWSNTVP